MGFPFGIFKGELTMAKINHGKSHCHQGNMTIQSCSPF